MPESSAPSALPAVSLGEAFWFWLKLGLISFGGPAGQIAIMHQELVEKRRWLSERRFLHALNYCMLLPGPEAQQLATYIGWLLHRTWGGVIAVVLFVLPSLFILIGLSWLYIAFGDVPLVAGIFYGIKPAVTAIVMQAAWRIGSRALKNNWLWGIAGASFVAIFAFNLPFPLIVLGAALLGYLGGRLLPQQFSLGGGHAQQGKSYGPALIDDDNPPLPHTRFRASRLALLLAVGALLWLLPMSLLTVLYGWEGTLTQMAWFFTKAALLTLVVAFVAFVGAYLQPVFGGDSGFVSGALAAALVTLFTFLPSFLFILAGGPLVESTHGELKFTAPLTAITAAVVGVILNLALFFAYHVLWPQGFGGTFDWPSALLAMVAALALLRFKRGVMEVLLVSALAGLAVHLLR